MFTLERDPTGTTREPRGTETGAPSPSLAALPSIVVRGFVSDAESGVGVGALRIEFWSPSRSGDRLVSVCRSDDSGRFRARIAQDDATATSSDDDLSVEIRVKRAGKVVLVEARGLARDQRRQDLELSIPPATTTAHDDEAEGFINEGAESSSYEVSDEFSDELSNELSDELSDGDNKSDHRMVGADGAVAQEVQGAVRGAFPGGSRIQALYRTLVNGGVAERPIGEAAINPNGWYRLRYAPSETPTGTEVAVVVKLLAPSGDVICTSDPQLKVSASTRIDLRVPADWQTTSEFDLLERRLSARLDAGIQTLDRLTDEGIAELARWLHMEAGSLLLLRQARALEAETTLPAAVFYALGRKTLRISLEDLVGVPQSHLRTSLREAVAERFIDRSLLDDLEPLLQALKERVLDHSVHPERDPATPGLYDILGAADVSPETMRRIFERMHAHEGGIGNLGEVYSEDGESEALSEGLDESEAREVDVALELGDLIGPDPTLLRHLHGRRRQGEWQSPRELSRLGLDDWCTVLEEAGFDAEDIDVAEADFEGAETEADADARQDGESADEELEASRHRLARLELRAEEILEAFEDTYPSEFIRRSLASEVESSPATRRLLERASDHNFLTESIRGRVARQPDLVEGIDPDEADAAIEEVAAVERVSRITHRANEVAVLVGTGMTSAMEIAGTSRRRFADRYADALGGREQASRIHAEAQQIAAASKLSAIRQIQARQPQAFVLTGTPPGEPRMKELPDAATLFGPAAGLCGCNHCGSVYSPAAYFVDLLRYLSVPEPKALKILSARWRKQGKNEGEIKSRLETRPLELLLKRRPDLAELPLSCENTLTPLPYIDLVNEVLEARVVGASAAFDTGKTPADVLRAVPQNTRPEAYRSLRSAVYPVSLPFDEPLCVARAYLGHLGVTRLELMQVLGKEAASSEAIVAEALGMSPGEISNILRVPSDLWLHFGFEAEFPAGKSTRFSESLTKVPAFLHATGVSYAELIQLVSTRFVNADDKLKLDSPAVDCDPGKVTIAGLDDWRLSRLLRVLRLQRRLAWTFEDLDRTLFALGALELDVATLSKLADIQFLAKALDRPVRDLLVLWAPLDTWGTDNPFGRIFLTRAVAWTQKDRDTFALLPDRSNLKTVGDDVDVIAPALLAAYRITSDELNRARAIWSRRGAPAKLDLAGLSALFRVVVLARALQLRIESLDGLLRLVPLDADPFRVADPAATRRFVAIAKEVQDSDFTPDRLLYIFRHEFEATRNPGPLPTQVTSVLANIRRGLLDAFSETSQPADATGDILRQKLAIWLDSALVDGAMDALDPRSRATLKQRQAFFDRHLARIFADPAAASARLFAAPPTGAANTTNAVGAASTSITTNAAIPAATTPTPVGPTGEAAGTDVVAAGAPAANPPAASSPAVTTPVVATPANAALERHWQENIRLVFSTLLPALRTRQTRGAVVQTLGDVLGLSSASTSLLLDGVLHSRRQPATPLLRDFLALLGSGLTASYFANADCAGAPVLVRPNAEPTLADLGSAFGDSAPTGGFSARWSGFFFPRTKAEHVFYVTADGSVRLTLKVDGVERVLIASTASRSGATGAGATVETSSDPVALDPSTLYELVLEYRVPSGPGNLAVQLGTGPTAKQPLQAVDLFPPDGLSSLAPLEQGYRQLHKASLLVAGFSIRDAQLEWLTSDRDLLDLDALPIDATSAPDPIPAFQRWRQLASLYTLARRLPRSNVDLFDAFRAEFLPQLVDRLLLATGWPRATVEALLGPNGLGLSSLSDLRPPATTGDELTLVRLARAIDVQRRVGVPPEALISWARSNVDADISTAIVQSVKARYDEKRWLEVARALNDPLRAQRRDALVDYLLPRMRDLGLKNRASLFEYFLIDVEMSPCMMSSRMVQATSAVQTFFQRCLMKLESVPPRFISDDDWKWMKNYRVWEANRKVFLYPENWIEPELRDDKTPLFQDLERTILQQEIKKENVEAAFADYLSGLDDVSRLDVRAVYFERRSGGSRILRALPSRITIAKPPQSQWDEGTYHVFGRSFSAPFVWYHRRLENGRTWTPWEKLDADIDGEHLVPIMFQRRLHLFWTLFREANKPVPPQKREEKGPPPKLGKDWEIQLAYSVFDRGRWSRKRLSDRGVRDDQKVPHWDHKEGAFVDDGSRAFDESTYTLRATVANDGHLQVRLYRRKHVQLPNPKHLLGAWPHPMLLPGQVELVGRFGLDGTQGALTLEGANAPGQAPLTGSIPVPGGFEVSAMGFARSPRHPGALVTLHSPNDPGMTDVLKRAPHGTEGTRIVPILDEELKAGTLSPFFFQDRRRSYFVRPVYTNWRAPRLHSIPIVVRPTAAPLPPFLRRKKPVRRGFFDRLIRGRLHEEEDTETSLPPDPESQDAREDAEEEAWHPDDAAEARQARPRSNPPRPVPTKQKAIPAKRAVGRVVQPRRRFTLRAGFHEQRLLFTPFEHPSTGALIRKLKEKGLEQLLALETTRPEVGTDHNRRQGPWRLNSPTAFQRAYMPGALVENKHPPHLDIDFDSDNPYSAYNWELFFHAPLQVAVRLAKDGRHEEAQRWFHFIFDPTTDASSPAPKRFWRFAPFHENTEFAGAQQLSGLLSPQVLKYDGNDPARIRQQKQATDQLAAWWENPFSPHVIARLRIVAYQKAVVMKYIDNLIEWGDKLFRRDSMESINEATQLYILANNILGHRPEQIPPVVEPKTLTFADIAKKLDLFANAEVQFESERVRRPFRMSAKPDVGAATSVLGMATQYFCVPGNPQMDKYWDTVADRLFKIRNCMNIQGVVRQLPLFEPPIDPSILVRAAAAGVDLGSVIASLNAPPPHYRFRFLIERAVALADELRGFGAMTLEVLEKKDAEALSSLRAHNETGLLESIRDIRKKQVRQVEEELAGLSLEKEQIDLQMQHITTQMQEKLNPQEAAKQKSLLVSQVIAGVSEGIDLVSKVLYAIPDFQTGAAGGFSSPFVTLQLGGQMFGDISSAFASSLEKVMSRNDTEADMAESMAEYQRRQEEWQHELDLLGKEKAQLDKKVTETQLKLEICSAELRSHDIEVENARKVERFFRDKYTNEQLYGWMLGQLSGVYFQAYKVAFDAAQQAERALRFERGDTSSSFVEFSYWDSLKKGLLAGERLLVDLRRMESAYVEGDRRALELTRNISLRDDYPLAFQELLARGQCEIEVTEALLDGDFPGHYFRRLKTVSLSVLGVLRPNGNVNCTLTLLDNRIRTSGNASGNYAPSEDVDDSRFLVNFAPIQAVATSRPNADAGVFDLKFDDSRYLPFEGAGAISKWRLELNQADNAIDVKAIDDLIVCLSYTARNGGSALESVARASREKGIARGGITPAVHHQISLKRDLPIDWKRLMDAAGAQDIEVVLPLWPEKMSGRLRGLDVRVERVTAFAQGREANPPEALRLRLDPPKGTGSAISTWAVPWQGARTFRAAVDVSGGTGSWKLVVPAGGAPATTKEGKSGTKLPDLFDDLILVFELRARRV